LLHRYGSSNDQDKQRHCDPRTTALRAFRGEAISKEMRRHDRNLL
jgi:hypothetical protein